MIGFKIKDSNKFVILPNIDPSIADSYFNTFPSEKLALSTCKHTHTFEFTDTITNTLRENGPKQLPRSIGFYFEITEQKLLDLGQLLNVFKDINDRVEELVKDFDLDCFQKMNFTRLIKRVEPLQSICPQKYLHKLSVHLDVFLMNFYEIKEVTDSRYSVDLILEKTTKSDLLLGNHVESKIYLLLPY